MGRNKGYIVPDKTKLKISKTLMGHKVSEETRLKLKNMRQNISKETREKLRQCK